VFFDHPGIEVASAGVGRDADTPLDANLVEWADIIFVMEKSHREKLTSRFRSALKDIRVICLDIPDKFAFMEPALVGILKAKVTPLL
jgi:predicted protein tyrosine phosphatase